PPNARPRPAGAPIPGRRHTMKRHIASLLALACLATSPAWGSDAARATKFPTAPVSIIVPVAAGGGLDLLARQMAPFLSERWGQSVIVQNRPGVAGWVGAVAAARSAPDGHTLLIAHDALTVSNRFLFKDKPIDLENDLAPITPLVQANQMLLASP